MKLIYLVLPLILQIGLYLFVTDKGYIKVSILIVTIALYFFAVPAIVVVQPVSNIPGPEDVVTCGPPPTLILFTGHAIIGATGTIMALLIYFGFRWLSEKTE